MQTKQEIEDEYEKIIEPDLAEYWKIQQNAWAEYKKIDDIAWAKYKKITNPALDEMDRKLEELYEKSIN